MGCLFCAVLKCYLCVVHKNEQRDMGKFFLIYGKLLFLNLPIQTLYLVVLHTAMYL